MSNDDDEMSDAEVFRAMSERSRQKREDNREAAPAILTRHGLAFETHNAGVHLIVTGPHGKADFWPGTGKWIVRAGGNGRGVFNLIKKLAPQR